MPLLAPVTITLRPVRSGMSVVLKVVMDNDVDTANNAVNDNFVRRAPRTAAYVAVRAADSSLVVRVEVLVAVALNTLPLKSAGAVRVKLAFPDPSVVALTLPT